MEASRRRRRGRVDRVHKKHERGGQDNEPARTGGDADNRGGVGDGVGRMGRRATHRLDSQGKSDGAGLGRDCPTDKQVYVAPISDRFQRHSPHVRVTQSSSFLNMSFFCIPQRHLQLDVIYPDGRVRDSRVPGNVCPEALDRAERNHPALKRKEPDGNRDRSI